MYQNNESPYGNLHTESTPFIPKTTAMLTYMNSDSPDTRSPRHVTHAYLACMHSCPHFSYAVGLDLDEQDNARDFWVRSDLFYHAAHINVTSPEIYDLVATALGAYKEIYAEHQLLVSTFESDRWLHVHILLVEPEGADAYATDLLALANCFNDNGIVTVVCPNAKTLE